MTSAVATPAIPFVDLAAQYAAIKDEVGAAIGRVIESQAFIQGPYVKQFEAEFCAAHGAKHGVGCSNGTAAIELALRALGVGPGDEVITVPNTFFATVEAIATVGATPVFVDIDPRTHGIDGQAIEAAVTKKTRAILPVHLYGNPCDMDAVMAVAERHGLVVVEDAAQAHLATYRGRFAGTIGDAGTFSFYPGKNLGAYGDAGFVFSRDAAVDTTIRKLLDHGRMGKYEHDVMGANNRMDGIQAAVLSVKMRHLAEWTKTRRAHAALYAEGLDGSGASVVQPTDGAEPARHLFVIEVGNRDEVAEHLRGHGVATGIHYPLPLHLQPALASMNRPVGSFPVAERAARRILSLPICGSITRDKVEFIAARVRDVARP